MFDLILADLRALEREMLAEAQHRRALTSVDAGAEVTEHWASALKLRLDHINEKYATVSAAEYAKIHGGVPSSVRRWCEAGEIAGAVKDATGEWRIPRGAVRRRVRGLAIARTG